MTKSPAQEPLAVPGIGAACPRSGLTYYRLAIRVIVPSHKVTSGAVVFFM